MLRVKGTTLEASFATGLGRFPSSPRGNEFLRHSKQGTGFPGLVCRGASDCAPASASLPRVLPPSFLDNPQRM
jgi:hypothetical protein